MMLKPKLEYQGTGVVVHKWISKLFVPEWTVWFLEQYCCDSVGWNHFQSNGQEVY
jgi:hypothetical protein